MSFDQDLISIQRNREKLIHDTWIDTKGITVSIKPVKLLDNGEEVKHDLDPFDIDVKSVGYEDGSIKEYNIPYNSKAIFINADYQFQIVSYEIMLDALLGNENSSNFNSIWCLIKGAFVPKYSILTFAEFQNIKMRVEQVTKKRPISNIYKYKLVRC